MGDYTYMRGKVKIKPDFVEALRPRFTRAKQMPWKDLLLPAEIKSHAAYVVLCDPHGRGEFVPDGYSSALIPASFFGEKESRGRLTFSEDGELDFMMGFKNYDYAQEAFVAFLHLVAESWKIEQDWQDTLYFHSKTSPVTEWKSHPTPTVINPRDYSRLPFEMPYSALVLAKAPVVEGDDDMWMGHHFC